MTTLWYRDHGGRSRCFTRYMVMKSDGRLSVPIARARTLKKARRRCLSLGGDCIVRLHRTPSVEIMEDWEYVSDDGKTMKRDRSFRRLSS